MNTICRDQRKRNGSKNNNRFISRKVWNVTDTLVCPTHMVCTLHLAVAQMVKKFPVVTESKRP